MACQACEGCNKCNTCQGCDKCNKCDTCDKCDKCNSACETVCDKCNTQCNGTSGCLTKQTFCLKNQVIGLSYPPGGCITKGETIAVTASAWNTLVTRLQTAYNKPGNNSTCPAQTVSSNEIISAAKINSLANAIWGLGGASGTKVSVYGNTSGTGDLITATVFGNLQDGVLTMKYKDTQCDQCNAQCNVTCNACQGCNKCNKDNKCTTGNKCTSGNNCGSSQTCSSGNTKTDCCESKPSTS